MLTLEQFEEAIKTLQEFEEEMETVDKILHKDNVGFIDNHSPLITQYVKLLESHFDNADEEWISYWLYEDSKWVGYKDKEYDITEVKDLYYWLCQDLEKVKLWEKEK